MFFSEYPYTNKDDLNLDYILKTLKQYITTLSDLTEWREQHEKEYEELKTMYNQLVSGNFPPDFITELHRWLSANAFSIIGEMVKNVFFGLTDSGYFVAYIPESWRDIKFNTTGYDIEVELMPEYGHLTLSY